MTNKEFIQQLALRMEYTPKEAERMVADFVKIMASALEEGSAFSVAGFGTFEVRKKSERVMISPATKQRMLVPPKLVVGFKASGVLKEKIKIK